MAPGNTFYCHVRAEDGAEIVLRHIIGGAPVERLLYAPSPREKVRALTAAQIPFYQGQVLHNCGLINPESLDEAIGADRYFALAKALLEMTPEQVCAELKAAGLRGAAPASPPG